MTRCNAVWRLEKGKKPQALIQKFHPHWTTRGLDGHIYSESFQEIGGAAFRIALDGGTHVKVAEESHLGVLVFAVGKGGELIFQRGSQIVELTPGKTVKPFRNSGDVAKGEPALQQVIAYSWADNATLYLSDGNNLRRVGSDGVIRLVASIDGKLMDPKIWNSTGAPRIWSIAVDDRKRIYTALPDIGHVVRIDPDGSQHVIDRSVGDCRVTAVAVFDDSVFLLESSASTNAGQRVRVMRSSGRVEFLGQVESENRDEKPNLSGTWRLVEFKNIAKTQGRSESFEKRLVISHIEPEIKIITSIKDNGREKNVEAIYFSDGRGETNSSLQESETLKSKTRWTGNKLPIGRVDTMSVPNPAGGTRVIKIQISEQWELSKDENTLTKTSSVSGPPDVQFKNSMGAGPSREVFSRIK